MELEDKKYEIAQNLYSSGKGTKPYMLQSYQRELLVQKDIVDSKANTLISVIGLYKSVGGKNLNDIKPNL